MKDKWITAAVVFAGIVALGVGARLGVPGEYLAAGGSALLLLAGSMKSMWLGGQPTDTEKK